MKMKQLRHFIPVSGPGTREPATGEERDFRLSLGFTPRWFHKRLEVDFSDKWHQNPSYRYETMLQMKSYLNEMFPYLENFRLQTNEKGVETSCATLSGVYGICAIGAIYGLPVQFRKDGWPDTVGHYTKQELSKLKPIRLSENVFVQQMLRQMDRIEELYGTIDGYLAYQGVLNNAFRLMGEEILIEMLEDPPFAEFLFSHICETMLEFIKLIQGRQRESGFEVDFLSVSNCVINMISPDMYEEFLLPHDQKLAGEFETFGVHTCNWDITRHIEPFSKIGSLGYLDMGMMSDMKKVRETFPDTRLAVLYHPNEIMAKSLEEVRADFERICREAAPVDLALADIEVDVPDELIHAVAKMACEIQKE